MRISGTMPILDIHTTDAVMEIHSDPVKLKIEATPAQMKVTRARPKFKANWSKAYSQMGLRSPSYQRKYQQQTIDSEFKENVANKNSDHEQMGNIAHATDGGPELVASVAMNRVMRESRPPELNVASMPSEPLEVDWEPGDVSIEWTKTSLEMSWEGDFRPKISVTPHSVEIRLIDGNTVRVREAEAAAIEKSGQGKRIDETI